MLIDLLALFVLVGLVSFSCLMGHDHHKNFWIYHPINRSLGTISFVYVPCLSLLLLHQQDWQPLHRHRERLRKMDWMRYLLVTNHACITYIAQLIKIFSRRGAAFSSTCGSSSVSGDSVFVVDEVWRVVDYSWPSSEDSSCLVLLVQFSFIYNGKL